MRKDKLYPSKEEMERVADRLTRQRFKCEIETQGKEHIVRCNYKDVKSLDNGTVVIASVIPKVINNESILDVSLMVGGDGLINDESLKKRLNLTNDLNTENMTKKGFDINIQFREKYSFPVDIRGRIKAKEINEKIIEDINDFINDYARNFG